MSMSVRRRSVMLVPIVVAGLLLSAAPASAVGPTRTMVGCAPQSPPPVGRTTCLAFVADADAGVDPSPTGVVTLYLDAIAAPNLLGQCTLSSAGGPGGISFCVIDLVVPAGTHAVLASYAGGGPYAGSVGTDDVGNPPAGPPEPDDTQVVCAPTTAPGVAGPLHCEMIVNDDDSDVSPILTGTVSVFRRATAIGSCALIAFGNGLALCNAPLVTSSVPAGPSLIGAVYPGSATYAATSLQSLPAVVAGSTSWTFQTTLATAGADFGPFSFGTKPLVPLTGDWDGNGVRTPGTYEAGTFKLTNTIPPDAPFPVSYGSDPRGFPVAGDFDGDGKDDLAVYRNGIWQVRYTGPATTATFSFGSGTWPATVPVAGDWDGDGVDGIGTFTMSSGTWSLRETASTGPPSAGFVFNPGISPYPVVGDWDGNGTDTVGVKAGTDWMLSNSNSPPAVTITFSFGAANALPVVWRSPQSTTSVVV